MKRILVSNAAGTIAHSIADIVKQSSFDDEIEIIGSACQEDSVVLANAFSCVVRQPPNYNPRDAAVDVAWLRSVVIEKKIDFLIPTTDYEADLWSKDTLPALVSSPEATSLSHDKWQTWLHFQKFAIPFAPSILPSQFTGQFRQFVAKPRRGGLSVGLLQNPAFARHLPDNDYLIQDYLSGPEFTIAFYFCKDGRLLGPLILERNLRYGFTIECKTANEYLAEARTICEAFCNSTSISGPCNIQCRLSDGRLIPFEVNCRFSGTCGIRHKIGFRDVVFGIEEYLFGRSPELNYLPSGFGFKSIHDHGFAVRDPSSYQSPTMPQDQGGPNLRGHSMNSVDNSLVTNVAGEGNFLGRRTFVHLDCACEFTKSGTISILLEGGCSTNLERAHRLREAYQGTVIGRATFEKEHPDLTAQARHLGRSPIKQPIFFVASRNPDLVLPAEYRLFGGSASTKEFLKRTWDEGIDSILLQGGPTVIRSFLEQAVVDIATIYLHHSQPELVLPALFAVIPNLPRNFVSKRLGEGTLLTFEMIERTKDLPAHIDVQSDLKTKLGNARQIGFSDFSGHEGVALIVGDLPKYRDPLLRIHSACVTGDIFGSVQCDCGHQLLLAKEMIKAEGCGILIYLPNQEGRGIGIRQKQRCYNLQREGLDTYAANRRLGFPEDLRRFDSVTSLLKRIGIHSVRLISNNPVKARALQCGGVNVSALVPISGGIGKENERYLNAKVALGGHLSDLVAET